MAGIKVNMTDKEAASESRDLTPLPAGKYLVCCTEGTQEECGPESKNPGKPYYKLTFTVQDGEYENRLVWANLMLFSPALYSAVQILKALGIQFEGNNFQVPGFDENEFPDVDWLMGQELVIRIIVEPERTDKASGKTYQAKNEVKGYFHKDTWKGAPAAAKAAKASSLLP
jgi:hypothetical protein